VKYVLQRSRQVWGFVNDDWLREVVRRFGPLTHHIQLKASILMDALRANGIAIDATRWEEKLGQVGAIRAECRERLRRRGYLAGEEGCGKALQSILAQFQRDHPGAELKRMPSGEKFSTAEEDLGALAGEDDFFSDYIRYRSAEKLEATYLKKMGRPRIHPGFGYLLETGRTYCGGGFNLQNLPRESDQSAAARTIRGCFVPGEGRVFVDSDYSQIELVVLAHALRYQFGHAARLADVINSGQDVHTLIAASVLDKPASEVTKEERASVKPISFGRPGGMGPERLCQIAKTSYGVELTREGVEGRIGAYERLCPELKSFLEDELNPGLVIATTLNLTPVSYCQAIGKYGDPGDPASRTAQAWLGACC
jgi:DNA polymerase-1